MPRRAKVADPLGDAALQRLAGAAVFERGKRYAAEERCSSLREGDTSSEWLVQGSEPYRVQLELGAQGVQAECSCPHAQDGAFCKHMVAAALNWRASAGEGKPSAGAADDTLRAFLQQRPAQELAARLLEWAGRDRALAAELKAWRAGMDDADTASWKDAVDTALRKTRNFYDVADCGAYARQGAAVLPVLRKLVARDPLQARDACVLALRRIFAVGEQGDDSNGSIGDLLHDVHDVLLDALRAARPKGDAARRWLRTWLSVQERDPWGLWDDTAMLEAAGADVRAAYSVQVAKDWAAWLADAKAGSGSGPDADDGRRWRVRTRYLDDRRFHGDTPAVLEALRADVRGGHEVAALAAELTAAGRVREAVQTLERAAKASPDDWHVEQALLAAYDRDGCVEEVLVIRRRQLERRPGVEEYAAALDAAEAAGRDRDSYRSELHRWAQDSEAQDMRTRAMRLWRPRLAAGVDVTVRLRWLLHDGRTAEALELVRQPGCVADDQTLRDLARRVLALDVHAADWLFSTLVDNGMRSSQSPYRHELDLVGEWMKALPPELARQRLSHLQQAWKAKRNFVAGLQALAAR